MPHFPFPNFLRIQGNKNTSANPQPNPKISAWKIICWTENASLKKENTELKKSAETDAKELERLGEVNSVLEKEKTEAAELAEKSQKELEDYKAEHEKTFEENNNSIIEKRKTVRDFNEKRNAAKKLTQEFVKNLEDVLSTKEE